MSKQRMSFDMDSSDHKYLKMCCAKLGVSIKDFIISATNEKIHEWEDVWFSERQREEDIPGNTHVLIDHEGNFHDI